MDRDHLAERAARGARMAPADAFDEVQSPGLRIRRRLGTHPAQYLFRIGQKGEDRGRRGRDMGLADQGRRWHRSLLEGAAKQGGAL